jgi:hypothetical protein
MNSTIITPFQFQKTTAISFLADVCRNLFGLFGESVCIHGFEIQHSQIKPRYDVHEKFIAIFVVSL